MTLSGDTGARSVMERHRDSLTLIESDDPGVVLDIDEKVDLGRIH